MPFFVAVTSVVLVGMIGWEGMHLLMHGKQLQFLRDERGQLVGEIAAWDKIISAHPGYRDGYLEEALLYYRLGDTGKSKAYLDAALQIDPNFKEGLQLAKLLGGK